MVDEDAAHRLYKRACFELVGAMRNGVPPDHREKWYTLANAIFAVWPQVERNRPTCATPRVEPDSLLGDYARGAGRFCRDPACKIMGNHLQHDEHS